MSKIQVVSVELDNHRGSLRYWEDTLLAFGDRHPSMISPARTTPAAPLASIRPASEETLGKERTCGEQYEK